MESQSQLLPVLIRVVERREQWLVKQGVSVDSWNVSVEKGVQVILEYLEKEHITSVTEERLKAVWHESEQEAVDEIVALIHQGINVKSPDEDAALRYAAKTGFINVVSLLLERSANAATHDEDGMIALHLAAFNGHTEVVSLLLEHGADVATSDNDGRTSLYYAAGNGHTEVVALLLGHGADVAAKEKDGRTALHYAARNDQTEVVSLLLEHGADVADSDNDGMIALHLAALNGHTKVVSLLLEHGTDVATSDNDGRTSLYYAAVNGNTDVVSLLLLHGADVSASDNDGRTALHYVTGGGYTEVVSLLLEHGADVATSDNDGRTSLYYAVVNGHAEVVSLILEHGADVSASDNEGLTLLHHAVTSGSIKVVSLLLEKSADAHTLTKEGHNALSHVILVKHDIPDDDYLAVVRLLCSQKHKIELPSSTQKPLLKKHQLGMLACAQYWQDRYENNEPLLEVPSEVVKNGEAAVKSYLAELEKMDASTLVYRQKICVVGPSTWGKTSLVRSTTKETPVLVPITDRTTGIDLFSLRFPEVGNETEKKYHDVTFWDFAGQDVYHVAHAVFSKRTLYLVCIDLQAYDEMLKQTSTKLMVERNASRQRFFEDHILRWMIVVLFRQPDAQFKLIGTKHDKVSDSARIEAVNDIKDCLNAFLDDRNGIVQITDGMKKALKQEFNKEMLTTSVTSVESIQKVKEAIKSAVINNRGLSFPMPEAHTKVLEHIKYLRRVAATRTQQAQMRKVFMPVNELCRGLMKIPGLRKVNCLEILRVLHELGDILWYQTSEEFKEWIILDPTVMLDLVREVVYHDYENKDDEKYKALWTEGRLPHSLLVTFPSWKCLGGMNETGEMVHLFKRLLHHLNLVYPVNGMRIDKADIIVPMYWKAREKAKKALKPLTKQNTILEQNFGGNSYIAKWRYSLPIDISEAVFVNFVVKCYRPYIHREVRETHFVSIVYGEFHAAVYLKANETGHYDDITIEVAASTKKLAWAEMMHFVIDMERVLEYYSGLTKHGKLKRCIADDQGNYRDVNYVLEESIDEARLRQTKAPWLPPDFSWFIQGVWKNPHFLDKYRILRQVEVSKKLVATKDKRRLPALWSLAYPKDGEPVEVRIHSDFSGKCWHEPLKIQITDNFFTNHSQFVQVGVSVLSVVSGTIPISLASDAVVQVLAESKEALAQATTVKAVLDRALFCPGEEKSSKELGMGLAEREEFVMALLAEHNPPLNERTIGHASRLGRVAIGDGQYLWVNEEELDRLQHHIMCEPETYVPINPTTISLRFTGATGSWDARIFTKMYCEWKLLDVMKNSVINDDVTEKAAITSTGEAWGSNIKILNVGSIEKLRKCTLQVWVKQTRRLTGYFRNDKVIAQGEKQLDVHVDEDCSSTETIDVSIDMGDARTVMCQITIKFE